MSPGDDAGARSRAGGAAGLLTAVWLIDVLLAITLAARWARLELSTEQVAATAAVVFMAGGARWALHGNRAAGRSVRQGRVLMAWGVPLALSSLLGLAMLPDFKPGWRGRRDGRLVLDDQIRPEHLPLRLVSAADGIDAREADSIVAAYLGWLRPLGEFASVSAETPILVGSDWRSTVRGRRDVLMREPIHVSAVTGGVGWTADRPSFPSLRALKDSVPVSRHRSGAASEQ
jgi:hypothetical protein